MCRDKHDTVYTSGASLLHDIPKTVGGMSSLKTSRFMNKIAIELWVSPSNVCIINKISMSLKLLLLHMSCLVHGLHSVWCLFQGWVVGTLGNILSGFVTQDPRVSSSEACAIQPAHPVRLVACTSEANCCAYRLVHKWINKGLRSLWTNPKSITSKCMGCIKLM